MCLTSTSPRPHLDFTRFDLTRMAPPDELGPAQVLLVRDPAAGLEAIVVVDNLALGPAIGGVRLAKDVLPRLRGWLGR